MEVLEILEPPKFSQPCDLCGYPHGPVSVYVEWIERFGQWHIFKEGKKAGRPTMRTAQTQRWEKIVERHKDEVERQVRSGL